MVRLDKTAAWDAVETRARILDSLVSAEEVLEASIQRAEADKVLAYPNAPLFAKARRMQLTRHLYAYGTNWEPGPALGANMRGERIWSDAEQFLEMLDAAEPGSPQHRRLDQSIPASSRSCLAPREILNDQVKFDLAREDARVHVATETRRC